MNRRLRDQRRYAGAALVEFALTVALFMMLVLAIMEVSLLVLEISRANEMTRAVARMAIVSDPLCDLGDGSCPGPVSQLDCPDGAPVVLTLADFAQDCEAGSQATACRLLVLAQDFMPAVTADQVEVSYACSAAGYAGSYKSIPLVTVAMHDLEYHLALPGLIGIDATIAIPGFRISRTAEDLHTENMQ